MDIMWRKYSLSSSRKVEHRPHLIFEKKEIGRDVFYRVVCHHHGREVKEWLTKEFLTENNKDLLDKF